MSSDNKRKQEYDQIYSNIRIEGNTMSDVKTIYELDLHETVKIRGYQVTRIAGGWIYTRLHNDWKILTSTFVPYNEEFKEENEPME